MKRGHNFKLYLKTSLLACMVPWKTLIIHESFPLHKPFFYSEKRFLIIFIKMFFRLWWKWLFVEPKMVQIKVPKVSLFLQQKQRNLWNLNISDYRLTESPRLVWEIIVNETHCEKVGWPEYVHLAVLKLFT